MEDQGLITSFHIHHQQEHVETHDPKVVKLVRMFSMAPLWPQEVKH